VSVLAIELNDTGILVGDSERCRDAGPGYAMLDPEGLTVGEAARRESRLRPRRMHNRFWRELDAGTIPVPSPHANNCADLACAQLQSIWQSFGGEQVEAVIFTVPGFYSRDALGLLLGIAQATGIPARGLVDTAVAASGAGLPDRRLAHLDCHLHSALLTELTGVERLSRGEIHFAEAAGLADLGERWIKTVAEAFVRQTRFDPLHHAVTEQMLFDSVPGWIDRLAADGELGVTIEHQERTVSAKIARRQMLDAAEPFYERIVRLVDSAQRARGPLLVQMSHRLARLPGLAERLRAVERTEVVELPEGAAIRGALARSTQILTSADAVAYVTSLDQQAASERPAESAPPATRRERSRPTHLLNGAIAYPIGEQPLQVGTAPPAGGRAVRPNGPPEGVSRRHCSVVLRGDDVVLEDHSRYGTWVNERRIEGQTTLHVGDVVRVGSPGGRLLLIELRS
jgi:hypothetical protein